MTFCCPCCLVQAANAVQVEWFIRCGCGGGTAGHQWSITACITVRQLWLWLERTAFFPSFFFFFLPLCSTKMCWNWTSLRWHCVMLMLRSRESLAQKRGGKSFSQDVKWTNTQFDAWKRSQSVEGNPYFFVYFKVTLQTSGSCFYWLTLSPKNSPMFCWFSTNSSNSFQNVFKTLSNIELLQDV